MVTMGCASFAAPAAASDDPHSLAAQATASSPARSATAPGRKLTHKELVALASMGARFRRLPPSSQYVIRAREFFRKDGTYETCGDLNPVLIFKFEVRDDTLCVVGPSATTCRRIYKSPSGEFFQQDLGAKSFGRVEITPATDESCSSPGDKP